MVGIWGLQKQTKKQEAEVEAGVLIMRSACKATDAHTNTTTMLALHALTQTAFSSLLFSTPFFLS